MYTNFERCHVLEAMKSALTRYDGPKGIMAKTPEGVDDDIWQELEKLEEMLDKRIAEIWKMDLEAEAI